MGTLKLCITLKLGQIILKIIKQECPKELCSSNSMRLVPPTENGTFQDKNSSDFM